MFWYDLLDDGYRCRLDHRPMTIQALPWYLRMDDRNASRFNSIHQDPSRNPTLSIVLALPVFHRIMIIAAAFRLC